MHYMNNIILTLIITFTKLISFLPRTLFTRNSLMWRILGNSMKKGEELLKPISIIALRAKVMNGEMI